jgi:hypothetical protein
VSQSSLDGQVVHHVIPKCESVDQKLRTLLAELPESMEEKLAMGWALMFVMPLEPLPWKHFDTSVPISKRPLQEKAEVIQMRSASPIRRLVHPSHSPKVRMTPLI